MLSVSLSVFYIFLYFFISRQQISFIHVCVWNYSHRQQVPAWICVCVCVCCAAVRIYATTLIMPPIHSLIGFLDIYFPISLSFTLVLQRRQQQQNRTALRHWLVCRINGATCDEKWITRGYENCRLWMRRRFFIWMRCKVVQSAARDSKHLPEYYYRIFNEMEVKIFGGARRAIFTSCRPCRNQKKRLNNFDGEESVCTVHNTSFPCSVLLKSKQLFKRNGNLKMEMILYELQR